MNITSRFVMEFAGKWDYTRSYDPFTVVTWKGRRYVSKTYVPENTGLENYVFWGYYG